MDKIKTQALAIQIWVHLLVGDFMIKIAGKLSDTAGVSVDKINKGNY